MSEHDRLNVAVAGVTGWTGHAVARAVAVSDDLQLCAGVSRSFAGRPLADVVPEAAPQPQIWGSVAELLSNDTVDVIVDYTSADAVLGNVSHRLHGAALGWGTRPACFRCAGASRRPKRGLLSRASSC